MCTEGAATSHVRIAHSRRQLLANDAASAPGAALSGTARSWRGIVPVMHLAREGRMTVTIGRRELLAALGGAAAAWPLAVARAAGGDADDWIHEWYLARPYCAAVKSAFL